MNILHKIQGLLAKEEFNKPEFANDISGLISSLIGLKKVGASVVVDTEDPHDLLLCGTDVPGSCQRVDGNPNHNKGLLGYMMDGKNRLLAVKDAQGKILARAIFRILWDGKKPVLFLERRYPDPISGEHELAIRNLARIKAKHLGLVLVEHEGKGETYPGDLESFGGPAPYEYVDSAEGIQEKGKYTLGGCTIIA